MAKETDRQQLAAAEVQSRTSCGSANSPKTHNLKFRAVSGKRGGISRGFPLLQLRVLRPSLSQNRHVRVSFLPERKKILTGFAGTIFISNHTLRASELKMGECTHYLLSIMDANGIAASALSLPDSVNPAKGPEACQLARRINEQLADIVSKHPTSLRSNGDVTATGDDRRCT
jgi:hypothetical protein